MIACDIADIFSVEFPFSDLLGRERRPGLVLAVDTLDARHFPIAFTPGSRILDIGCGSGRDLQALLDAATTPTGSTPPRNHFLLEKVGFHRINRWDEDDTLAHQDRRWTTQLFVLQGHGSRSRREQFLSDPLQVR